MDEGITQDELNARNAIAAQIWDSAEEFSPENRTEEVVKSAEENTPEEVAKPEGDIWAGIPPALKDEFEGLRTKAGSIDSLVNRLQQAERRIGSMSNELHAAKEAAKAVEYAPTKEQIADAANNAKDWDELKEAFPEWTNATEGRLAIERAEILKHMPNAEVIKRQVSAEVEAIETKMAGHVVSLKHPNWMDIRDSSDFKQWNETQGNKDSSNPIEVIAILDDFTKFQSSKKTPAQINAERQQRLEQAQTITGHKLPTKKSEADMTESELRAAEAKRIWG